MRLLPNNFIYLLNDDISPILCLIIDVSMENLDHGVIIEETWTILFSFGVKCG